MNELNWWKLRWSRFYLELNRHTCACFTSDSLIYNQQQKKIVSYIFLLICTYLKQCFFVSKKMYEIIFLLLIINLLYIYIYIYVCILSVCVTSHFIWQVDLSPEMALSGRSFRRVNYSKTSFLSSIFCSGAHRHHKWPRTTMFICLLYAV